MESRRIRHETSKSGDGIRNVRPHTDSCIHERTDKLCIWFAAHDAVFILIEFICEEICMQVGGDGEWVRMGQTEMREYSVNVGTLGERDGARIAVTSNLETQKPADFA